jgi:Transglycosylase-like domain
MATLIGFVALITVAQADVDTLAQQAGVDPVDLQGAVNTTHLPPTVYLHMTGELVSYPPAVQSIWDALAECESSGRWNVNTGNGYYGGLQEDLVFWRNYGGPAYASRPDLASPAAQIAVAAKGQRSEGWKAWPVCSRRLGLR